MVKYHEKFAKSEEFVGVAHRRAIKRKAREQRSS